MANFKRRYPRKNGARRFWQSYTVLGRLHKHRKNDARYQDEKPEEQLPDGGIEHTSSKEEKQV